MEERKGGEGGLVMVYVHNRPHVAHPMRLDSYILNPAVAELERRVICPCTNRNSFLNAPQHHQHPSINS